MPVIDGTGKDVLLYEVGMTGMNVDEVEFTSAGPVALEVKVDKIGAVPGGAVPVPHVEGTMLVLLPYGAVG